MAILGSNLAEEGVHTQKKSRDHEVYEENPLQGDLPELPELWAPLWGGPPRGFCVPLRDVGCAPERSEICPNFGPPTEGSGVIDRRE